MIVFNETGLRKLTEHPTAEWTQQQLRIVELLNISSSAGEKTLSRS